MFLVLVFVSVCDVLGELGHMDIGMTATFFWSLLIILIITSWLFSLNKILFNVFLNLTESFWLCIRPSKPEVCTTKQDLGLAR